MLNVENLKKQLQIGLSNVIKPAIEEIERIRLPEKSKVGEELSKQIAESFDEMVSEELADIIANAIDYYVKNISISGTIITTGSPATQVAKINPTPTPVTAGKIPNTLGIS